MQGEGSNSKYIVAVSGGVDSVVLLDMLAREGKFTLVVAHFDHGIRPDSYEDAVFVQQLAEKYQLPFELGQAELGEGASEEAARKARYDFLRSVAKKHHATIVTAHHADDVLETIVINIWRGTGWRGLASLRSTEDTARPLLRFRKKQLVEYAAKHNLMWQEDSTNQETHYLRNRIRHEILPRLGQQTEQILLELYQRQVALRAEIEEAAQEILKDIARPDGSYRRYEFIMLDENIAREVLYELLRQQTGRASTKERLGAAHLAIKTAREGSRYQIGDGITLVFQRKSFTVVMAN